ncbi:ROK family protein [Streptomyces sp. SID2888]|uniref:ROK family protein n=1 Tax=Streptomyces sp. SID2888 TaxID=2690256 RepID=UPI001368D023|nr:ROK family protein [Streptomyces sp. SID2888]
MNTSPTPASAGAPSGPSAVAALDVGGTKIAAGLVAADGTLLHRRELPTDAADGGLRDPGLAGTARAARALLDDAARLGVTVTALGAGFPEYVDADGLLTSREVLAWDVQPAVVLGAEAAPGLPVAVGSDVRCGALGEARHGVGRDLADFFYVSLGTGLSSTLVLDGRPVAGRRGEAIALGELEVPASVDPDWHGNLERYCSGRGIGERRTTCGGSPVPGAREVTALACSGDRPASRILTTAGQALGTVLGQLVRVLDPSAIVLGGGLGTGDGPLHTALREAYAHTTRTRPGPPPLRRATLGQDAGLIGAAALCS